MSPDRRDGPAAGALVAIVGPSGVGKDSLMSAVARHPALPACVRFARRIVTRVPLVASEDHDSLDEAGFAEAEAAGSFALAWGAHGLRYALPISTVTDVANGLTVVANLSRRSLDDAAIVFARLHVVEVTARAEVLFQRLTARGRESEVTVRERLARDAPVRVPAAAAGHLLLDNSGALDVATGRLVRHLNEVCDRR